MSTQSVFLFPGQGSQYVGMGRDLHQEFPEFAKTLEEASDVLGFNMQTLCFDDPNCQLNLTEFTQPAILSVSTGVFRVLQAHTNLKPYMVAGHSLGEYSALVALGALPFSDALKAVRARGKAMQEAVPIGQGGMAAYIGSQGSDVEHLCRELSTPEHSVEIANYNSPSQFVLSGHSTAIEKICQIISEKKLGRAIKLAVSAPFHSSLMKPAENKMQEFFKHTHLHNFSGKIVANVDAKIHTGNTYTIELLIKQISSPVLWTQTLNCLYQNRLTESGNEKTDEAVWIEVGPGKVLQGLTKKTFENQKCHITENTALINAFVTK